MFTIRNLDACLPVTHLQREYLHNEGIFSGWVRADRATPFGKLFRVSGTMESFFKLHVPY